MTRSQDETERQDCGGDRRRDRHGPRRGAGRVINVASRTFFLANPGHLANLIAFLASDEAEMITGQFMLADGGGYLH